MNEENENENKINHDEQNNNETNHEEQNQNNQISNDGNKSETNTESSVNQASQSAKKSNTGLIVTIIILAIIIIALIGVGIFLFVKENVKDFVEEGVNEVSTIIDQGENIFEQSGMLNTLDNVFANNINNSTTNTIDTNTNTNSTTNTGSNGTASASSLENPLQVGEWGIASKYNTETRSDQDVNVSVTNIIRGEEAAEMAKEYMSSDYSIYKYEEPEAYLEWVVIEYDVDFADTYIPGELGASPNVEADITGPDGSSVKYNGITYITSTIEIGSRDYIKTKTGSGKILTQIPIGCTDYIIQFGRYGGTTAYFQGK